jgi:hypothetical protein
VVTVAVEEQDSALVISIKDTGIGIAPADQVRLFERFYRVKRHETVDIIGSGLGLAIVKSIAQWHRGRVWVESQVGEGATFYILILPNSLSGYAPPRVAVSRHLSPIARNPAALFERFETSIVHARPTNSFPRNKLVRLTKVKEERSLLTAIIGSIDNRDLAILWYLRHGPSPLSVPPSMALTNRFSGPPTARPSSRHLTNLMKRSSRWQVKICL